MRFENREEAGKRLAERVKDYLGEVPEGIVLALSRGGVVVGDAIANQLKIPLDLFVVKKIRFPGAPEWTLGAVDRDGRYLVNSYAAMQVDRLTFEAERLKTIREADLEKRYISAHTLTPDLAGKTVILVDDGAQTGTTALAAAEMVRSQSPEKIILALPVCSREAGARLDWEVEALIVDTMPPVLHSLEEWYSDFAPENENKVRTILQAYVAPSILSAENMKG